MWSSVRRAVPGLCLLIAAGPVSAQETPVWEQVLPAGPFSRHAAAFAFDEVHGTALLFGGLDSALCLTGAGGVVACDPADLVRLNVDPASPALGLDDAVRLARKAGGLDSNP